MNIVISAGAPNCTGEVVAQRVEMTDMGTPGPWIKNTCRSCDLHWYAERKIL